MVFFTYFPLLQSELYIVIALKVFILSINPKLARLAYH